MKGLFEHRVLWKSPAALVAFGLTALLFAASVYPLYIMVRTAFQSVGDPLEGTPDLILVAEASRGNLTLQNMPMVPGRWSETDGFLADPEAWALDPGGETQIARAENAAWRMVWESDLRRFRRILVEVPAGDPAEWRAVWQNMDGDLALQGAREQNGRAVLDDFGALQSIETGEPFAHREVVALILLPPFVAETEVDSPAWSAVTAIPRRFTHVNFTEVWRADAFSRYTFNSLFVALMVTIGVVITSLCAGYAFARSDSRIRHFFWVLVIGSMLIPAQVLIVPAFLILQHFPLFGGNDLLGQGGIGLLDSYTGLILPNMVMPLGIFMVRQSLLSLPDSYEEAAVMDGAKIRQVLFHIVAPLQRPILATVALLAFLFNWNSFIFPLILIQSPEMRTLPVGLALYSARHTVDWVHLMAAATITALPIFILFIFFQRQLISGLVHEGVKG